jgi:hypothetical protein
MMSVWKWSHHYAIVEAVEPFKLHPTSMSHIYKVFEHLKQLWMGIWQHTHTVTTTDVSPDLGEFAEILDDVSVEMIPLRYRWGCRTFKLHPTSMSYIYKVFEHLKQLWMGIWQHTNTVTTTEVSPEGFPAEILDDVSVEMIPLRYRWGCRTFQTASHIYVIYI